MNDIAGIAKSNVLFTTMLALMSIVLTIESVVFGDITFVLELAIVLTTVLLMVNGVWTILFGYMIWVFHKTGVVVSDEGTLREGRYRRFVTLNFVFSFLWAGVLLLLGAVG